MGLNLQKGLEGLSQGLSGLYEHQIYKDQASRQARLDAATQAFRERQIALQEKQFASDDAFRAEQAEFQRGQTEFMNEFRTEQLDLDRQATEANIQQGAAQTDIAARRVDIQEESLRWQQEQTERANEIAAANNKLELYEQTKIRSEERAQELRDALREMEGDLATSEEARARQTRLIEDELFELAINETEVAMAAGIISRESFGEQGQEIIGRLMEMPEYSYSEAEAIAALNLGMVDTEAIAPDRPDDRRAPPGGAEGPDASGSRTTQPTGDQEPFLTRAGRSTRSVFEDFTDKTALEWGMWFRDAFTFPGNPMDIGLEAGREIGAAGAQFIEGFTEEQPRSDGR